jgi:excisionase family DNA binding protein
MTSDKLSQDEEVMTLGELAKALKLSWKTVWRMVKKGEIKAQRIGGQWRVAKEEHMRLIGKNNSSQAGSTSLEEVNA